MKLIGPNGKPIETSNKGHEDVLNLIARVQNLEAVIIMLATLVQKTMIVSDSRELDIIMEAFYKAQTARGASHLSRELTDDNPAVFI